MLKSFFESVLYESGKLFGNKYMADILIGALLFVLAVAFVCVLTLLCVKNRELSGDNVSLKMQNNKLYLHSFFIAASIVLSLSVIVSMLEYLSVSRTFASGVTVALFNLVFLIVYELLNFVLYAVCAAKNKKLVAVKKINEALREKNIIAAKTALERQKQIYSENAGALRAEPRPDPFAVKEKADRNEEQFSRINSLMKKIQALPLSHADEILVKKYSLIVEEEKYNIDCNLPAEKQRINEALSGLLKIMARYSA